MHYSNDLIRHLKSDILNTKDKVDGLNKNSEQVSVFIDEGNPNAQEEPESPSNKDRQEKSLSVSRDQQSALVVKQAIKDDQGLAAVAHDIHVTVKEGVVTLDGTVSTEQEMNLATNTAADLSLGDTVNNKELSIKKSSDELIDASPPESAR